MHDQPKVGGNLPVSFNESKHLFRLKLSRGTYLQKN